MKTELKEQQNPHKSTLAERVLTTISKEKLKPRSRWYYLCSNFLMWFLWALSVVVGAIAVAQALYVSMHAGIEFYEMTHTTLSSFVVDSLPYVWLIAFVIMCVLAYFNLRQTKKGYKYPFWQIVIGSLSFTLIGGMVLHVAGVGSYIDTTVALHMPPYRSAQERQEYLWTLPEAGRITGVYIDRVGTTSMVLFKDMQNTEWIVETRELMSEDRELLFSKERVRLIGEAFADGKVFTFYTCGVFPWIPKDGYSVAAIQEMRENVEEHVRVFAKRDPLPFEPDRARTLSMRDEDTSVSALSMESDIPEEDASADLFSMKAVSEEAVVREEERCPTIMPVLMPVP